VIDDFMTTLIRVIHAKNIKDHIDSCDTCKEKNLDINSFKVIRSCNTEYETRIHEALFIKKHNPQLKTQVHANGSSFLLSVY